MADLIKFNVPDIEGDFFVDKQEMTSYRTIKALALSEENPAGMFLTLERLFDGKDEEYVERVGGVDNLAKLIDAATEAVKNAKN